MYLFGQLTGGSAFSSSLGQYTYEEFLGLGFYRLTNDILLAARLRQQTVWNWNAQRQLLLDNDAGLRGYSANNIQGDNRIVANLEMRVFPDYSLWITNFPVSSFLTSAAPGGRIFISPRPAGIVLSASA